MKKTYIKPITSSYKIHTPTLFVGSTVTPYKTYHCPYDENRVCEKYSEHMNKWSRAIEHYAKNHTNHTIFTGEGCIYEKDCSVYKHFLRKQNSIKGK